MKRLSCRILGVSYKVSCDSRILIINKRTIAIDIFSQVSSECNKELKKGIEDRITK